MPALRLRHLPVPNARRCALAMRVAQGLTPAEVAAVEGEAEADVAALLAQRGFAALVQAWREVRALPEAERLVRLEREALLLLEQAMALGDLRAAAFVVRERRLGRNPARTLARGLIATERRRPPEPTPEPEPGACVEPAAARPAVHPDLRAVYATAGELRRRLLGERARLLEATPPEPPPPEPEPPASPPPEPPAGVADRLARAIAEDGHLLPPALRSLPADPAGRRRWVAELARRLARGGEGLPPAFMELVKPP